VGKGHVGSLKRSRSLRKPFYMWVVLHTTCTYHVHGVEISFSCSWTAATFHPQGWACNSLNWRYATAGLSKRLALLILGGRLRVLPSLTLHLFRLIQTKQKKHSAGSVMRCMPDVC
jgi:hypothetical protein